MSLLGKLIDTKQMIIEHGMIGQIMALVEFPDVEIGPPLDSGDWALTEWIHGSRKTDRQLVVPRPRGISSTKSQSQKKSERIAKDETRYENYNCDAPCDVLVALFGMMSRICRTFIERLMNAQGVSICLFRPVTMRPIPYEVLSAAVKKVKMVICIEFINMGQMLEDVKLEVGNAKSVAFLGKAGGLVPFIEEVMDRLRGLVAETKGRGEADR